MGIYIISSSQDNYCFIENKGQLPKSVHSKVKVPSGAIFIEKEKFIYAFTIINNYKKDIIYREKKIGLTHSISVAF